MSKSLYIEIAVNVILSIITSVVSSFFIEKDSAFIVGLSTFFLFSLVLIQVKMNSNIIQNNKIIGLISGFLEKGSFREVFIKQTLFNLDKIKEKGISSNSNNYWELWLTCIGASQKSWIVTNYAKVDVVWDLSFSDKVVNIQREKILNGQKISRIFIFDTIQEKDEMKETLNKQLELKTEIRWLIKSTILKNQTINTLIKKVGTIDFAIVDDDWIFRTYLDRNRRVKYVNAIKNTSLTDDAKTLMDELIKLSKKYENNS